MAKAVTRVEMARPIDEVFSFLSDFNNSDLWTIGLVEVRFEGPLRLGASGVDVRTMGRKNVEMPWVVVDFDPPREVAFEYSAPFPMTVDFVLEEVESGTRVTCETSMRLFGLWKLMSPLIVREVRRTDRAQFERARQILESQRLTPGSDPGNGGAN